jgi:UDP-GlcNAc:undecaprenyl-phosphate GlcNAc-1-phosphate transferase
MNGWDAATLLLPAIVSFLATPLVMDFARRRGLVDRPGPGKIHDHPVPTLGGLGLAVTVLAVLWLLEPLGMGLTAPHTLAVTLAALPVLAVGVADDLGVQSIPVKLAGHAFAGLVLFGFGIRVSILTNPFGDSVALGPLALPVTVLWVVVVVNAMNLCDGLDGLAAGIGGIAAFSLAIVGALQGGDDVRVLGLVLAGAIVGFYPYNLPKASIFLGDVGSTFLGLALATVGLIQNHKTTTAMTLLLPLVALGLPVFDTAYAVVRRAAHRRSPLQRDLGHLHHRFLGLGLSPRQVLALLLALTAALGATAVSLAEVPKQAALLITVVVGVLAFLSLLGLVRIERRAFRASQEQRILQKV